jgi:hypothetical protein
MTLSVRRSSISRWLFVFCGVWLVAQGLYFILLRPALLPEDVRFVSSSLDVIRAIPRLVEWLNRVFTVVGGFMVAVGVLTLTIARSLPRPVLAHTTALALAGVFSVGLMCFVNFQIDSDFKWVLAVPAAAWLLATISYARGK